MIRIRCQLFVLIAALVVTSVPCSRAAEEPPKKTLFLPKSPVAAAYVLARLSNKEFIKAPRSEFVYVAERLADGSRGLQPTERVGRNLASRSDA